MLRTTIINDFPTKRKAIAFTFDDGPNPLYTLQILDIFQKTKSKATFYMIGSQIERYPQVAQAVHEQGHEIGNHTYTHPNLTKLDEQECMNELIRTQDLMKAITGVKPLTFRPPYLDCNEQVARLAESLGYKVIGAVNVDARDWEQPGVQHIIDKTREHVKPGSIFLFHDGFGDRSQTIEAILTLVPELIMQGYELVTVSELMKLSSNE